MSLTNRDGGAAPAQGGLRAIPPAAASLLVLILILLGVLGWAWQRNRTATWEQPNWDAARFTRLHSIGAPPEEALHLVAVNPLCPRCVVSLDRALERRNAEVGRHRIGVLVVDTPRQPSPEPFARRGADETWWDHNGVWRERWGHRIYGEILMFDASGRYIATQPPPRKETE